MNMNLSSCSYYSHRFVIFADLNVAKLPSPDVALPDSLFNGVTGRQRNRSGGH